MVVAHRPAVARAADRVLSLPAPRGPATRGPVTVGARAGRPSVRPPRRRPAAETCRLTASRPRGLGSGERTGRRARHPVGRLRRRADSHRRLADHPCLRTATVPVPDGRHRRRTRVRAGAARLPLPRAARLPRRRAADARRASGPGVRRLGPAGARPARAAPGRRTRLRRRRRRCPRGPAAPGAAAPVDRRPRRCRSDRVRRSRHSGRGTRGRGDPERRRRRGPDRPLAAERAEPVFVQGRAELSARVEDMVAGMRQLVAWQAVPEALAAVDGAGLRMGSASRRSARGLGAGRALVGLGCGLGLVAMARVVPEDSTSAAMLALLLLLPLALADAVLPVVDAGTIAVRTRSATRRLAALTGASPVVTDPEVPTALPPGRPTLEVRDVTAGWAEEDAVRDLSATLSPGRRLGLVGPSGSGKSTVAALLIRFLDPRRGALAAVRGGPARPGTRRRTTRGRACRRRPLRLRVDPRGERPARQAGCRGRRCGGRTARSPAGSLARRTTRRTAHPRRRGPPPGLGRRTGKARDRPRHPGRPADPGARRADRPPGHLHRPSGRR